MVKFDGFVDRQSPFGANPLPKKHSLQREDRGRTGKGDNVVVLKKSILKIIFIIIFCKKNFYANNQERFFYFLFFYKNKRVSFECSF